MQINLRDIVFIKNRKNEYPKSLKLQYIGPMRVIKVYPLGLTAYHVLNGDELSAHYNHVKKLTLNDYDESFPKQWEADIKKLILHVAKAKRSNRNDIIFEETDNDESDNNEEFDNDGGGENMTPDNGGKNADIGGDDSTLKANIGITNTEENMTKSLNHEINDSQYTEIVEDCKTRDKSKRQIKPPIYLSDYIY